MAKASIDDLTVKEARELAALFGQARGNSTAVEKGQAYFFRTVTHYYTGRIVEITDNEFVLEDAAWIADTGRFSTALASGELNEIEPYPGRVIVFRAACIDASPWPYSLPRGVK